MAGVAWRLYWGYRPMAAGVTLWSSVLRTLSAVASPHKCPTRRQRTSGSSPASGKASYGAGVRQTTSAVPVRAIVALTVDQSQR